MKLAQQLLKWFAARPAPRAPAVAPAPLMLALEPRIVYEASVAALPAAHHAEASHHHSPYEAQKTPSPTVPGEGVTPTGNTGNASNAPVHRASEVNHKTQLTGGAQGGSQPENEVVFVDTNVTNYQELLTGLPANVKVVLLNPNSNGLEQIAQYVQQHPGIDAINLISHGAEGQVQVGNVLLDQGDIAQYSAVLAKIGAAMKPNGDFLIYGCDVAAGSDGASLVHEISALSGLNVAASTNLVGSAALGGSWTLNYDVGNVHTPVVLSSTAEQGYDYVLSQTVEDYTSAAATSLNTGDVTSFTLDGITYTYNIANNTTVGPDSNLQLLSDENGSSESLVVNQDGVTGLTSITITMADGENFKMSSLDIDVVANTNVLIEANGSTNNDISLASNNVYVTQTVDLTTDSAFNSVNSITITFDSGSIINLGHLVYEEALGITATGGATTFTSADSHSGTPVTVDSGVTVSDIESTTISSASVAMTGGFQSGQDVLGFTSQNGITGAYNATTGVLTLTGTATIAQYQAALESVTYLDTAATPNTSARTISFSVNDGISSSTTVTKTVDVVSPPSVTTTGGTTSYTDDASATTVDSGVTVADPSQTTQHSGTVSISGGFSSGDTLAFTNTSATTFGNITGSYNSGTGVLTLSSSGGTATDAQWEHALDAVTFSSTSTTHGDRTISFVVNDGTTNSTAATKTVDVVDAPPVVTTTAGTTGYVGGTAAVDVDSGVTVSDFDNTTQASGTVSITSGFDSAHDTLSFTNSNSTLFGNITASFSGGVLTLSSAGALATDAQWASAFEAVRFSSTSTTYGNRTISFVVNDGTDNSTAATKTVDVTNPAPVVTTDSGSAAFVAGDNTTSTPVTVDSGLTLTDPGTSTIASATVSITGNFQSSEDRLSFTNTNSTTFGNIAALYNSATGVLTLTSSANSATLAQWQSALEAVKYTDTAITPNNATRTISFSVTDANSNTSSAATRTVTVADTDQTPIVGTTGGTTNYVGGTGAATIDGSVTVTDLDNTTMASGAVTITTGFQSGDTLSFTNTSSTQFGNIVASYNSGTGVLTLASSGATSSDAQWAHAFSAITFSAGTSATPGNRTISFVVNDGIENSAAATDTVDVLGPPTITTNSGSAAFVAGDNAASTPVAIDSGLTLSDGSASTFGSATVRITGNFQSGEDVLTLTNNGTTMGNITGLYNATTGVLTLTSSGATATTAQWQAALDAVTYTDIAVTPNNSTRTISFTAVDGSSESSNTATRTVTVADVDQTPIVATTGGTTNYVGGTSAVTIDSGVTVSDLDNTTQSTGTVSITSGFRSGDTLSFTNTSSAQFGNITAVYNAATGVLTLTSVGATSSDAQWAHAFSAITFSAGSTAISGNRTISFVVNDGIENSAAATHTVDVLGPPTIATDSGSAAFVAGDNVASTPVAIDSGLSLSDGSASTFASATVQITGNYHSGEDVLSFTNTNSTAFGNIQATYNGGTGVLTLTSSGASATTAQWKAALDAVTYTDTAITPNNSTRTISFTAVDSNGNTSNTATRTVTVADTYQTPILTTSTGATSFVAGDNVTSTSVAVDSGLAVTDLSSGTLATATVSITGGFHASEDSLSFANDGATMGNIAGTYDAGTGVLSLSSAGSSATLAQWRAALDSILYTDSAITPDNTARTISFTVNDGTDNSALATKSVTVADTDQTPIVSSSGSTAVTYVDSGSGGTPVTLGSGITVSDRGNATLTTATVAVSGNYVPGVDVLTFTPGAATGDLTASFDAATGVLTLHGDATSAQMEAALGSITFSEAGKPVAGERTISVTVSDGVKISRSMTSTVDVQVPPASQTTTATSTTSDIGQTAAPPPPPPFATPPSTAPDTSTDADSDLPPVLIELDHPASVGGTPFVQTFTLTDPNAGHGQFSLDHTSVTAAASEDASLSISTTFEPQSVVVDYDISPNHAFVMNLSNLLPTADGMRLNAMSDVTVRLADGRPLPTWLHYDAADGVLTGALPAGAHDVRVVVLQRDADGHVMQNEVVLAPSGRHSDHEAPGHGHGHGTHAPAHASRNALAPLVARERDQAPLPAGKPSLAQQFAQARAALHVVRPVPAATAAVPAATEHRA
ncbi:DUF4347 domain-containing protein [Trinickia violacea]|nr:DUF4347 domain-containing protein [Trinickia violacea]